MGSSKKSSVKIASKAPESQKLENDSYMMRRIRKALGSGPFFRKQRI
jgi:hypothetical protein